MKSDPDQKDIDFKKEEIGKIKEIMKDPALEIVGSGENEPENLEAMKTLIPPTAVNFLIDTVHNPADKVVPSKGTFLVKDFKIPPPGTNSHCPDQITTTQPDGDPAVAR